MSYSLLLLQRTASALLNDDSLPRRIWLADARRVLRLAKRHWDDVIERSAEAIAKAPNAQMKQDLARHGLERLCAKADVRKAEARHAGVASKSTARMAFYSVYTFRPGHYELKVPMLRSRAAAERCAKALAKSYPGATVVGQTKRPPIRTVTLLVVGAVPANLTNNRA
jgi:hypothetical protein